MIVYYYEEGKIPSNTPPASGLVEEHLQIILIFTRIIYLFY